MSESGSGFDDIPGLHRRHERHRRIAGEQTLIAIGTDTQLCGDIAEQTQAVSAVDKVPAVVGMRIRHITTVSHRETDTHDSTPIR